MTDRRVYELTPGGSGVATGRLYRTDRQPPVSATPAGDPARRTDEAFATVVADLIALADGLSGRGDDELADIASATVQIGLDPDLRAMVDALVAGGAEAEAAVSEAIGHYAGVLAALPDPTLAARAADVRSVGRRLLAALSGRAAAPDGPLVLVAAEIAADDLLDAADAVVGAASVVGGATSHAAIVARSLGVPLGFGVDRALLAVPDGTEVLIDLSAAEVVVAPDADRRAAAEAATAAGRRRRERLASERDRPVRTVDGHAVEVLANVAGPVDADIAVQMAVPGVGLLRTEMPFLAAQRWPTIAEHRAALEPVLARLAGRPVTVRTLDFAEDKLPPFLANRGPLGRSLPLMLADPAAFEAQVRALLLTGAADIRIMVPMVCSAAELRQCQDLVALIAAEVDRPPPPVGAMVEPGGGRRYRRDRHGRRLPVGRHQRPLCLCARAGPPRPVVDAGQRPGTSGAGGDRGDRRGGGAARPRGERLRRRGIRTGGDRGAHRGGVPGALGGTGPGGRGARGRAGVGHARMSRCGRGHHRRRCGDLNVSRVE